MVLAPRAGLWDAVHRPSLVGEGWAVHTNAGAHLTTIDVKTAHDKDLLPLAGKKGPEVAGIIDPEPSRDRHEKTSMRCQQIPHVL